MIVYIKERDEVDLYDEQTRVSPALLATSPATGLEIRFVYYPEKVQLIVYKRGYGKTEELRVVSTDVGDFWNDFTLLVRSIYGREGYEYNKRTYRDYIKEKEREQKSIRFNKAVQEFCKNLGLTETKEHRNAIALTLMEHFPEVI